MVCALRVIHVVSVTPDGGVTTILQVKSDDVQYAEFSVNALNVTELEVVERVQVYVAGAVPETVIVSVEVEHVQQPTKMVSEVV